MLSHGMSFLNHSYDITNRARMGILEAYLHSYGPSYLFSIIVQHPICSEVIYRDSLSPCSLAQTTNHT